MNCEFKVIVTAVRVALTLLASTTLMTAHAQQVANTDTDADTNVKKVIITGSNIKTVDSETASPVQIIKREDITRQGVTNVSDLIANLSSSTNPNNPNSGLTDIAGNNTFAPGSSSASLRNLGEQSTLVLVNGRRIATYGFANFTDVFSNVDTIPIDAIDRVEVLKSGASAIYGSDAVAGVINIITRTNYQGVDVSADRTSSLQSHTFNTNKASITAGFGDLNEDGFNVMVNADFFKRDSVNWNGLINYTNQSLTASSADFGQFSGYSNPGNILDGANTQPRPGCAPNLITNGLCTWDRYSGTQVVPESDRQNYYASGTFNLGGGTQAFAEALLSKSKTYYSSRNDTFGSSPTPIIWANPTTGQPLTFNYLGLPATSPINPTGDAGAGLLYRFTDVPNINNIDGTQFRVLGGLRGSVGSYEWETAAGITQSKVTSAQQGGAFSSSGFISEIGDYNNFNPNVINPNVGAYTANDPNFFNQPNGYHLGGGNSPAVLNTLFPVFSNTGKTQAEFVDAKINGPLYTLPAGPVYFNLGGELRHESMNLGVSQNLQDGDIVGYGISTASASRNIESLYSELNVPVIKDMELSPALRLDKYPEISTHFSPKIGWRFKVADSLLLRATYEQGFRAPNLVESATSLKTAFAPGIADPLRCAQASALANDLGNAGNSAVISAKQQQVIQNECSNSIPEAVLNNPNLKPETSKSFSFGLVFEPVKGYSTSLDYWHIDRSNTIGLPSAQQVITNAASGVATPGSNVNRAPFNPNGDQTFSANDGLLGGQNDFTKYGVTAGPILNMSQSLENISEQSTSGVDIALKATQSIGTWGKLSGVLDGTYTISYYDTSISTASENLVGQYGFPHMVANFTAIWDFQSFSNSLRYNYTGGYDSQQGQSDTTWSIAGCASSGFSATQCRVASNRTTDYALSYTGIKNLALGLNIINIFQQKAAPDFRAFGQDGLFPPNTQDAMGRMLRLSLNYKFK
ncbi:TonB-dependent receptor domain-containing protein [Solimicrobium silvestre]|uniref:TonB dependent receptor n=1 Tax=Solimicrobium silvestre TaxID=2099400 RepID=A0A2S9H3G8_9BURK|nr:TonB-dependent receptor [Solimicrobium silvestre]PRC94510.1 TonB dependent receptor [Solimicrobium silvestre]